MICTWGCDWQEGKLSKGNDRQRKFRVHFGHECYNIGPILDDGKG